MIQIFLADGTDGTDEPTEGSTRGPRGPKKNLKLIPLFQALCLNLRGKKQMLYNIIMYKFGSNSLLFTWSAAVSANRGRFLVFSPLYQELEYPVV